MNLITIFHGKEYSLQEKEPMFILSSLGENIQKHCKTSLQTYPVNNTQENITSLASSYPIEIKVSSEQTPKKIVPS